MTNMQQQGYPISKPVFSSSHPKEICKISWDNLKDEWYRLMTFVLYPMDSSISTILLASKGFVYLGDGSDCKVICCFCRVILENIRCVDDIDEEHKRLTTECPMVNGVVCDNLPMEHRYPQNEQTMFSQFLDKKNQIVTNTGNIEHPEIDTRSSQPSEENAPSTVATSITDLDSSDSPNVESSQILDASSAENRQDNVSPAIVNSGLTTSTSNNSNESSRRNSNTQDDTPEQTLENSTGDVEAPRVTVSYDKLGIITTKPKRPEYSVFATRMASFNDWPRKHHLNPEDLAKAGFFFTGTSDCARCFHCGGGLRHWEPQDNVLVEHARWFPHCIFLPQVVGKDFVATVQALNDEMDVIKYDDVIKRLQDSKTHTSLNFPNSLVERDAAVNVVIDNGFDKNEIYKLAMKMHKNGEPLSSEKLYEAAKAKNIPVREERKKLDDDSLSVRKGGNDERDKETIETLRNDIGELRQQMMCKICMDKEVSIVFLPCGHLVSCTDCCFALSVCPLCRVDVKGIVKGYMV